MSSSCMCPHELADQLIATTSINSHYAIASPEVPPQHQDLPPGETGIICRVLR
jgi:hypothetical protein